MSPTRSDVIGAARETNKGMTFQRETTIIVALAFVLGSLVEVGSLYAMFATMGHAGPEGPFATIGWLATVMNLPGMFVAGILRFENETPTLKLAAVIYAAQIPFVWGLSFVVLRWLTAKLNRSAAKGARIN